MPALESTRGQVPPHAPRFDCLSRRGFTGRLQENVLARSLEGELTPDQIATVSDLKQVKRIVFNRLDEVALGSG